MEDHRIVSMHRRRDVVDMFARVWNNRALEIPLTRSLGYRFGGDA